MLADNKRVFIFLGETGSGKSEIALHWALRLAGSGKPVRFFDMDQTKPLFRSREAVDLLRENNVMLETGYQFLDSPIIPNAVLEKIKDPASIAILDVGGNVVGARVIGQLAEAWGDPVAAYFVVNCFRPFSSGEGDLAQGLEAIARAARVRSVSVICNPNFGEQTTLADVVGGYKQTAVMLQETGYVPAFLAAPAELAASVQDELPHVAVFGVARCIRAPWEK